MVNGGNVPSQRFQPTRKSKTVMRGANNIVGGFRHKVDQKGQLLGAITDGDLRRALLEKEDGIFRLTASQLMSVGPKIATAKETCLRAVERMEAAAITCLFVVEEGNRLIGLLRLHDILAAKIV